MQNLTIDLTKLAFIVWSGMLIISGSIWILTSQIRRVGDILEERTKVTVAGEGRLRSTRADSTTFPAAVTSRRIVAPAPHRVTRTVAVGFRGAAE